MEAGLTSRRKLVAQRGWSLDDLDSEIAADPRPTASKQEAQNGD
jgi:hypothetical protein